MGVETLCADGRVLVGGCWSGCSHPVDGGVAVMEFHLSFIVGAVTSVHLPSGVVVSACRR